MRILVTGGSGFVGKPLVRELSKKHEVLVFAREDDIDRPDNVSLYQGGITDKVSLRRVFAANKVDVVYHLAGIQDEEDPDLWRTNVLGTQRVIELCKERKIKQLVFLSTAGVLGEHVAPAKEKSNHDPRSKYDKAKTEAEEIVKSSGVNYTIVRVPMIIGPSLGWYNIVDAIKKGHPMLGDGGNKMHLVFVDDVVAMLAFVLANPKAYGQVFHIASRDIMTYREVYRTICKELRVKRYRTMPRRTAVLLAHVHKARQKINVKPLEIHKSAQHIDNFTRNWALSIQKTKDILGFQPSYTTPAAIHETIKRMNEI